MFKANDKNQIAATLSRMGILVSMFVLFVVLSIVSPYFLTSTNLVNILLQVSTTTVIGVGMTFVIITAGIDLSVGSVVALAALSMALTNRYMMAAGYTARNDFFLVIVVPMLAALAVGLVTGLVNGVLIAKGKLPPFIMTFGMMSIARGVAYIISNSQTVSPFPPAMRYFGNASIAGVVPMPIAIAILLVLIAAWVMKYTKFGRYTFAFGSNVEALHLSGVNVDRLQIFVYVICSMVSAIAAIILVGRLNIATPILGLGAEMDAIAAVIIGGTSIYGGEGNVLGTLVGAIFVGMIRNGLNLLNVDASVQPVVIGSAVVIAVFYDMYRKSKFSGRV